MHDLQLFTPDDSHAAELGRICYESFRQISGQHGFAHDLPDAHTAANVVQLMRGLPRSFAVAARVNGRLAGSNFMLLTDRVAGIGPLTVDPALQGRGIGRRLMQAALAHAQQHGFTQLRLMQDSYNAASLSLYASLGFDVREPVALLQTGPVTALHPNVRVADAGDLPALEQLSVRHYKVSRRQELAAWMARGFAVLVLEEQGKLRGYLVTGKLGHAVAEDDAAALALISQIPRHVPHRWDSFFVPLRHTQLYRAVLQSGCRLIKVMNLMTLGPYEEPSPVWMPSIAF